MKKLIFIIVLGMLGGFVQAQSSTLSKKEQRTLLKEEKKRAAAETAEQQYLLVESMVKSARFVLEADMLFDRYGQSSTVPSSINFVLVDSLVGVIQVGNNSSMGQNGVGGITLEGDVLDYEIKKNEKRRSYTVKYELRSSYGTYNVILNTLGGGRSEATVSGTFSGGSLRYSGKLVLPENSRVYKGSSF